MSDLIKTLKSSSTGDDVYPNIKEDNIPSGAVTNGKIGTGAVTTGKINDGAITTNKLADSSVSTAKIIDESITTDKLSTGCVTGDKIAYGTITTSKLADSSVTTIKITNTSVTTDKLANSSVTTDKLVNDAVTTAKIKDYAITSPKLGTGSVTTDKISDGTILTAKLGDGIVTTAKINDSAVTTGKINDGAVTSDKLSSALQTTISGKADSDDVYTKTQSDGKYVQNSEIFVYSISDISQAIPLADFNKIISSSSPIIVYNNIVFTLIGVETSGLITSYIFGSAYVNLGSQRRLTIPDDTRIAITSNYTLVNTSGFASKSADNTFTGDNTFSGSIFANGGVQVTSYANITDGITTLNDALGTKQNKLYYHRLSVTNDQDDFVLEGLVLIDTNTLITENNITTYLENFSIKLYASNGDANTHLIDVCLNITSNSVSIGGLFYNNGFSASDNVLDDLSYSQTILISDTLL